MLNYIDLFAGAGGLSEGFTATGFHPVSHVEMNAEACNTLKTRACYYYLKDAGQLNIYKDYLRGKITRDELYSQVPACVTNTVINQTMSEESMPDLFNRINQLLKEQKIEKVDLLVGGPPCQAYSLVGRAVKSDGMVNDPRNYLYKLYIKVEDTRVHDTNFAAKHYTTTCTKSTPSVSNFSLPLQDGGGNRLKKFTEVSEKFFFGISSEKFPIG